MISNMNLAQVEFQNKIDGVKQYMTFRKVDKEFEARVRLKKKFFSSNQMLTIAIVIYTIFKVISWFAYSWSQGGALDEERLLATLPDKLRTEIATRIHMDTLRQIQIFQDCEPGVLEALVLKLKLQVSTFFYH